MRYGGAQPAVNDEFRPRDIFGPIRREKHRGLGNVPRCSHPAQRHHFVPPFFHLLQRAPSVGSTQDDPDAWRIDQSRDDAVGADSVSRVLDREHPGKSDRRGLGRGVGQRRITEVTVGGDGGRREDDPATALHHARQHGLRCNMEGSHIGVLDASPVGRTGIARVAAFRDRHVVVQHVDGAQSPSHPAHQRRDRYVIEDVDGKGLGGAALTADDVHRFLGGRQVEIGDGNTIREYVTINRGTAQDVGVTRVGDDNWIMAYVHFAHDCQIGSHTIFANACQVAGHVHVGDWAILGATTLVHQFVKIGAHSFTAMGTFLQQDLPPYVTAAGNTAKPYSINSEGLRRRGFTPDAINALKKAYRTLYRSSLSLEEAKAELRVQAQACPEVALFLDFLGSATRGIVR